MAMLQKLKHLSNEGASRLKSYFVHDRTLFSNFKISNEVVMSTFKTMVNAKPESSESQITLADVYT